MGACPMTSSSPATRTRRAPCPSSSGSPWAPMGLSSRPRTCGRARARSTAIAPRVAGRRRHRRTRADAGLHQPRRLDRAGPRPRPGEPLPVRPDPGQGPAGHLLAERPHDEAGAPERPAPHRPPAVSEPDATSRSSSTATSATRGASATSRSSPPARHLAVGDYAVEARRRRRRRRRAQVARGPRLLPAERKLRYALAELSGIPRAAVVVEERYSRIFSLTHVRPAVVADAIAECQARYPSVPDHLRRDASARAGVDLPLPRGGAARGLARGRGGRRARRSGAGRARAPGT